jgi:hypothetical protein
MKIFYERFLTVFLTILATFFMNIFLGYLSLDEGIISVGNIVEIKQDMYVPIDISNYTRDYIDKLDIIMPQDVTLDKIIFSEPLKAEVEVRNVGSEKKQYLTLSRITPKTTTKILLPVKSEDSTKTIAFPNADVKKVKIEKRQYESTIIRIIKSIAVQTIVYIIIFLIAFYALFYFFDKDIEAADKKFKEAHKEHEEIKCDISKMRQGCTKCRLLLLAKINDYSKENAYWKDTIRSMLYTCTKEEITAEKLFEIVTNSLKTYSISKSITVSDFEAMKYLAELLSKTYIENKCSTES